MTTILPGRRKSSGPEPAERLQRSRLGLTGRTESPRSFFAHLAERRSGAEEFSGGAFAGIDAAIHEASGLHAGVFASEKQGSIEGGLCGGFIHPCVLADAGGAVTAERPLHFRPVHDGAIAIVQTLQIWEGLCDFRQKGGVIRFGLIVVCSGVSSH